jgi:phospholipid/cholesterol/gamma-HCH transport system ATP-binding protein
MVSVKELTHSFSGRVVLRDINLQVDSGEIVAIMGSSGGGKTTLLRCISGLIEATKGCIEVDGVNVVKQPVEARRRMGMVFQSAALFDYMNVHDNVLFGVTRHLKLDHTESEKVVVDALEQVGMSSADAGKAPAELSGGMRKRVGMARALALSPKVMLYDEPTTGLDPITTYQIDELICGVRSRLGMTSLIVSHDVNSVARVADRVAFLHDGELIFQGTPKEFLASDLPSIRELVSRATATTLV